jgi:hypothetical protein
MPATTPAFHVYRFFTEYKKDGTPRDWVEYGPLSLDGTERTRNIELVVRVLDVMDAPRGTNLAIDNARWRADFIRPRYENWKAGRETPEIGTPLAAWNGVSAEQADILKTKGVKTIERLATLTDKDMEAVPLPGMRGIVDDAKRYIASLDTVKVAADLEAKDTRIKLLEAEQSEMAEMVRELLAEKRARETAQVALDGDEASAGVIAKRGPGRPPRAAQAAA